MAKVLAAGTRLRRYEIKRLVGEGGMGLVYDARDTRQGRNAALKMSGADLGERFRQEARAVAALNHGYSGVHDAREGAAGNVVDRRADIRAFGAVLAEMLTGRRRFRGGTLAETLVSDAPAPSPIAVNPAVGQAGAAPGY